MSDETQEVLGKEHLMKGTYDGFYPKWNEKKQESFDVWKYALTGSPEAIEEYKRITLANGYKVNTNANGQPLFFTLKYSGETTGVKITVRGKVVINDEDQRKLQSLANNSSGKIADEIAKQGVAMLLGNLLSKTAPAVQSAPVEDTTPTPEKEEEVAPEEVDMSLGEDTPEA